jgi:hypothetical protein
MMMVWTIDGGWKHTYIFIRIFYFYVIFYVFFTYFQYLLLYCVLSLSLSPNISVRHGDARALVARQRAQNLAVSEPHAASRVHERGRSGMRVILGWWVGGVSEGGVGECRCKTQTLHFDIT